MEKMNTSIIFTCPGCKETFEFDNVGEYQFVHCPICGTDFMTLKKDQTLRLEPFDFTPKPKKNKMKLPFWRNWRKQLKVKCVGCERKFDVLPEIFANYEIIFCPICGLDHQVIKKPRHVIVKSTQFAPINLQPHIP